MRITIDIDPTTAGADGLDWLRQLLERHPDATIEPAEPDPLVRHVLDTFGPDDRLTVADICDRLAAGHPGRYAGWTIADLINHLTRNGIRRHDIAMPSSPGRSGLETHRGYRRADLEAAR